MAARKTVPTVALCLRFTIIAKFGMMVVEGNISQYAKVVVMSIT